jgi:uncharacterized protein (TIRG00374 family)
VAVAVIVGVFVFVLPKIANYGDVRRAFGALTPGWLFALALVTALNIATYAPNWMSALPGLGYTQSIEVTMAGTAVANVAPLGGAVSMGMQFGMLRAWGFETDAVSRAMVLTGIWNNVTNLGLPLVGLLVLTMRGGKNAALETAARIGGVVLVIVLGVFWQVLRSDHGAAQVGRLADRVRTPIARFRKKAPPTGGPATFTRFREGSIDLIRRRWIALTLTTVVGVLTVFVVLAVALRAVGVSGARVTYTEAFAAWASTRLLSTAFPVTPGGLGIVEVGLSGALVGFGGPHGPVVAAVLLYRLLTFVPPILLGGVAFLTWRHHGGRSERVSLMDEN